MYGSVPNNLRSSSYEFDRSSVSLWASVVGDDSLPLAWERNDLALRARSVDHRVDTGLLKCLLVTFGGLDYGEGLTLGFRAEWV
jgi:hypothetical protein